MHLAPLSTSSSFNQASSSNLESTMNRSDKPFAVSQQTLDPEGWPEKHGHYLYRYALCRLRNPELAEEKVQETFVGALQTQGRFQGRASERTWLTSILKRKIFDHFRKISRERAFDSGLLEKASLDSLFDRKGKWLAGPNKWYWEPDRTLRQKEFCEIFHRCLSKIPDRMAQVFLLREVDGHKGDEICTLMGISPTNLGVILYRARMRLRRLMEIEWFGKGVDEDQDGFARKVGSGSRPNPLPPRPSPL
jgi:RNA polymerase sigma-70 factor (TIGR02943 family)